MSTATARNVASAAERYRAMFEARVRGDDAFSCWRREAFERFVAQGFPTQRDEDWKYTNLRRLESRSFSPSEPLAAAADERAWIDSAGLRIAIVNGHAQAELSTASPQPPGVTVVTLGQWISRNPDQVAALLARQTAAPQTAFHAMNDAFLEEGVVIEIDASVTLDRPIYVVHQWTDSSQPVMSHPRILLRCGAGSRCTLIEHYRGTAQVEALTNSVVTIDLGAGAHVSHYRLQEESTRSFHIASVQAHLDRDSRYVCQDIALGGALARTSIVATLAGSGAEANLRGLFAPAGNQHIDTYTFVDHAAPHTQSNEEYRGIADGRGRGIYRGKVVVRKDAQKIDSRQSSRNLLLSTTAEIDSRPELEIYANDVKCSHGATTGQLDATSVFYLRSRGLSEAEARAVLIRAFAESILGTLESIPVRQYLEQQLHARFAGEVSA